jgi:hypothetical protein
MTKRAGRTVRRIIDPYLSGNRPSHTPTDDKASHYSLALFATPHISICVACAAMRRLRSAGGR